VRNLCRQIVDTRAATGGSAASGIEGAQLVVAAGVAGCCFHVRGECVPIMASNAVGTAI